MNDDGSSDPEVPDLVPAFLAKSTHSPHTLPEHMLQLFHSQPHLILKPCHFLFLFYSLERERENKTHKRTPLHLREEKSFSEAREMLLLIFNFFLLNGCCCWIGELKNEPVAYKQGKRRVNTAHRWTSGDDRLDRVRFLRRLRG